jgi:hypothetical protein
VRRKGVRLMNPRWGAKSRRIFFPSQHTHVSTQHTHGLEKKGVYRIDPSICLVLGVEKSEKKRKTRAWVFYRGRERTFTYPWSKNHNACLVSMGVS